MSQLKQYAAGAKVQLKDICRTPANERTGEPEKPGLLPISQRTWLNWVSRGIAPKGELIGMRTRVWAIEDVRAVGNKQVQWEEA